MNMIIVGMILNSVLWDLWNLLVLDGNRDYYIDIFFKEFNQILKQLYFFIIY